MTQTLKRWNTIFLAVLLGSCMVCAAEEIRVGTADNGAWIDTGTADSCRVTVREKWSRFAAFDLREKEETTHLLIRQDFEVGEGCFEGHNPESVKLTAFPLNVLTGKLGDKPLWQVQTVGVDVQLLPGDDLYSVNAPGCCAASTTTLYYSLRNGRFAGASTNRFLTIRIPNTPFIRFIMTQSSWASQWKGLKDAHIGVFYASKDGLMQSVGIILPKDLEAGCMRYEWFFLGKQKEETECELFDAKTIAGNAVVLESSVVRPFKVTLPFGEDGFDVSQAHMEGVEARLVTETYPAAQDEKKEQTKQDNG
jgi:hypothetical protein